MPLRAIYKPETPLKRWARRILPYAVAAFTTGAALGLSLLIPAIGEKPFFLLFFAATTACAWFYGISSGLASIGFSALAITYLILPRTGPLRIAEMDDAIRLFVFVAASIAVAWTVARLRRTQQALELAQERFELAHQIANIWSWELDLATGRVIWSSSAKNREEQREYPVQVWLQLVHADDRDRVLATLK
ncbi:MAG TPA: DUF4118 domain-containing protein, partial [Terriglobales bacterium]|nr:DUF4118 domain-containing protein [Terriglobales bacterium]